MIGFSLQISELNGELEPGWPSRNPNELKAFPSTADLRSVAKGPTLFYSPRVNPWRSVLRLIDIVEASEDSTEVLLISSGYPYLLFARGSSIISAIAEVEESRHRELQTILDPATLYFVEAWDLS